MAKKKPHKITTTVKAFVDALNSTYVAKKSTVPILTYARVKDGTMTDLDIATIVPFEAKGSGDFVIPHKTVLNALKGEKGPVTLEYLEDTSKGTDDVSRSVSVTCGEIAFQFPTLSVANYPQTPEPSAATLTIDGKTMATLIDRSLFAILHEESRYTINGMLIKSENGTVTTAATDGHRLAYNLAAGNGSLEETIVLRRAMEWVRRNCGGDVGIGKDNDTQTFHTKTCTILSRKLTGQFPNFEAVMPRDNKIRLSFDSSTQFANTMKRVAKCSDERSGAVTISVLSDAVVLSAQSTEHGSAKASVACKVGGPVSPMKISFNYEYFIDFLVAIGEKPFTLALKDSQAAGELSVDGFRYVVMPMRI